MEGQAPYNPADLPALLKATPPRWCVYLLESEDGRPIQLLTVKNLRAALKRRLTEGGPAGEPQTLSKKVNYTEVVRSVRWWRVHSPLEEDLTYLAKAHQYFPATYRDLIPERQAWFIHVDPVATFPQYTRTTDLSLSAGVYIGPIEGKEHASLLIEKLQGVFDLCRYHHILVEAPHGRACPYKDMRRCPAPCDGSISMDAYRPMVGMSLKVLLDPADEVRAQEARMRAAAADLKFEVAAKIKQHIADLGTFGKGPYRHARRLEEFAYLVLQRGGVPSSAKVFLATSEGVKEIAGLTREPEDPSVLIGLALSARTFPSPEDPKALTGTRLGIVAHHLFATGKKASGIFLPLAGLTEVAILKGFKELFKQAEPAPDEGEAALSAS